MTFDELASKIGHKPHKDRLGGAWKMSSKYKAIEGAFAGADTRLAAAQQTSLASLDDTGWQALEQDVNQGLDDILAAGRAYRNKHSKSQTKRGAADDLAADATRFKQTLKGQLDAIRSDPGYDNVKRQLSVEQALAAKRLGISFADCRFDLYDDSALDAAKSNANFGAGKMNTVAKLVHGDGVARIFKPEPLVDGGAAKASGVIGVDPDAPHYGNRNIATRAVADVLGTNVIPQSRYALHNGQIGLLMDKAPGRSPGQNVKVAGFDPAKDSWFQGRLKMVQAGKEKPEALAQAGYSQDDTGQWKRTTKEMIKPWAAPPSAKAQASMHEQLNQLEWCDLLSGQMDRQPENYMIEVNGDQVTITGIDNDLCFGKNQDKAEYDAVDGSTSVGKPNLIDRPTLDRIKGVNFDRDMAPRLSGLLSPAEIDASRKRFAAVRQHARQLEANGLVVDDWSTWRSSGGKTATEFLAAQQKGSIFARDLADMFKKDGLLQ